MAKAGANPFFLEELARHAAEPGSPTTPVALPETVHALLAARLDRLPPEAKHLVQTAAVPGNSVSVPVLHAIAEVSEEALQRGLAHLQAVAFLYEAQVVPEPTYTFKHTLTQEVAYGSLLQERRRALHARVVEALETLYADRQGEQAEQLADAWGAHRQRVQITGYLANHLQWIGAYDHALTTGQRALALAEALGDVSLQGLANAELGPIYYYLGDYRRAQEVLRRSIATLPSMRGRERLGHMTLLSVHPHAWLLLCLDQVGAFAEGRPLGVDAVQVAEAGHSPYS